VSVETANLLLNAGNHQSHLQFQIPVCLRIDPVVAENTCHEKRKSLYLQAPLHAVVTLLGCTKSAIQKTHKNGAERWLAAIKKTASGLVELVAPHQASKPTKTVCMKSGRAAIHRKTHRIPETKFYAL
jgi:hypothetical protein